MRLINYANYLINKNPYELGGVKFSLKDTEIFLTAKTIWSLLLLLAVSSDCC